MGTEPHRGHKCTYRHRLQEACWIICCKVSKQTNEKQNPEKLEVSPIPIPSSNFTTEPHNKKSMHYQDKYRQIHQWK